MICVHFSYAWYIFRKEIALPFQWYQYIVYILHTYDFIRCQTPHFSRKSRRFLDKFEKACQKFLIIPHHMLIHKQNVFPITTTYNTNCFIHFQAYYIGLLLLNNIYKHDGVSRPMLPKFGGWGNKIAYNVWSIWIFSTYDTYLERQFNYPSGGTNMMFLFIINMIL